MKRVLKRDDDSRIVITINTTPKQHQFADWGEEELIQELRRQGIIPLTGSKYVTQGQTGTPIFRTVITAKVDWTK